jgi:hypothetical protein
MLKLRLSAREPLDRILLAARSSAISSRNDKVDRQSRLSEVHQLDQQGGLLLTASPPLEGNATAHPGGSDDCGQGPEPPEEDTLEWYGDLKQYTWPRRACIRVSTSPDFELLVMLVIVATCVTLALYRPLEPQSSPWNEQLFVAGACVALCRPARVL